MRPLRQPNSAYVLILLGAVASALTLSAAPSVAAGPAKRIANAGGAGRQLGPRQAMRPAAGFGQMELDEGYRPTKFRHTMEDFNRWAHDAAPKPLTSAQIDRGTGTLFWPRLLMDYDDLRDDLDSLFAERAKVNGAIGNRAYTSALQKIHEMRDRLISTASDVRGWRGTKSYCEARNFLESLAYELDYVPPADGNDAELAGAAR
jgi:hypothetical protein